MQVNLGEVRTGDAKQLGAQGEPWLIPFLPHKSSLPHLLGQTSPLAPILPLLEILLELAIALCHLLLAKLITFLLLLQHEQQVFLPVALQIPRDLFLACLHPRIPKGRQLMGIALARQNGLDDRLSGHSAQITQHIGQLDVHLECCA